MASPQTGIKEVLLEGGNKQKKTVDDRHERDTVWQAVGRQATARPVKNRTIRPRPQSTSQSEPAVVRTWTWPTLIEINTMRLYIVIVNGMVCCHSLQTTPHLSSPNTPIDLSTILTDTACCVSLPADTVMTFTSPRHYIEQTVNVELENGQKAK